jgi:hypothetical protein
MNDYSDNNDALDQFNFAHADAWESQAFLATN